MGIDVLQVLLFKGFIKDAVYEKEVEDVVRSGSYRCREHGD